jgi:hypothetical protein
VFDSRRLLTRKTRSPSVIFFDIKNDVRRRPFSFNKKKYVANMKRKSSNMRRSVSSGSKRNDNGRRRSEP